MSGDDEPAENTRLPGHEISRSVFRDIKRPKQLEPPEILFTDVTSDIIISPEKSKAFIEKLLPPISNPNREETLKKVDEFFKDKKIPFKSKISDLDDFLMGFRWEKNWKYKS